MACKLNTRSPTTPHVGLSWLARITAFDPGVMYPLVRTLVLFKRMDVLKLMMETTTSKGNMMFEIHVCSEVYVHKCDPLDKLAGSGPDMLIRLLRAPELVTSGAHRDQGSAVHRPELDSRVDVVHQISDNTDEFKNFNL